MSPDRRPTQPEVAGDPLRILFAPYAPHQAVGHYRVGLPAEALAAHGHRCFVSSSIIAGPSGEVLGVLAGPMAIARDLDLIVVQPGVGSDWAPVIDGARGAGQAVVVDLDDWYPDVPASNRVWAEQPTAAWVELLRRAAVASDLITVSTPPLADAVRRWSDGHPVAVVRNAVDLDRWGPPEDVVDGPVLGYAGSMNEHAEDVTLLRGWLDRFMEDHDLSVVHVGDHPDLPTFAETAGVDPARVVVRPGVGWADYATSRPMAGVDIGLVPLEARAFNRAKSALKGMEYAACGIPFVASPSPEYRWLGCGVLAGATLERQSPETWTAALEQLLDPAERRRVAAQQTERLATEDIGRRWQDWEGLYRRATRHRRATRRRTRRRPTGAVDPTSAPE